MNKSITYKVLSNSLAFILGFSIVFILLGTIAGSFQIFYIEKKEIISKFLGVIVFVLGIHMLGLFRFKSLMKERKFHLSGNKWGLLGSVLVGMAFAFGWTPCVGPILAAILALALDSSTHSNAIILMAAYSLGLAIPFFLAALALNKFLLWFDKFKHHLRKVEIFSGILVMIVGIMIFFGALDYLNRYIGDGGIETTLASQLIGSTEKLNILIAFMGGLISFLSPCVLPLIPMYLSYLSGVSISEIKSEQ